MPNDKGSHDSQTYVAVKDHLASDLGGESVILSMSSGKYYGLNRVSQDIWSAIQAPKSLDNIVAELLEKYEIDRETCVKEVAAVLKSLADEGLVEIVESES